MQALNSGGGDAFLTKLTPDGAGIVYSTYLGGTGRDWGRAVAVDPNGNAIVVGFTTSTNLPVFRDVNFNPANSQVAFVLDGQNLGTFPLYRGTRPDPNVNSIFKLDSDGALTTLHAFEGSDGTQPVASLTPGEGGSFYGTTELGGANGGGTIFQLDSEDHVPFMFGDVGTGHITQCPEHLEVVAFGWACS